MKIKDIASMMYPTEEVETVCIETFSEEVLFLGSIADLRRNNHKLLNVKVRQLYTDKYNALFGRYGLTIVV